MSAEAWGDEGTDGPDGYVTEDRAQEMVVRAAQAIRETIARIHDQHGWYMAAMVVRNTWIEGFGKDPGKWEGELPNDVWSL